MNSSQRPCTAERVAIAVLAALGLATVVFILLGIWTTNWRWLATSCVTGSLFYLMVNEGRAR